MSSSARPDAPALEFGLAAGPRNSDGRSGQSPTEIAVRERANAGVASSGALASSAFRIPKAVAGSSAKRNSSEILGADHAVPDQRVEVDDLVPVGRPVEKYRDPARQLLRLCERQDLEELVHRAEAARKDDERAREVREPQLAHEEVAKLERQSVGHVGVRTLLLRQADVEADRRSAGVGCAPVGGLHDAATATGADDESVVVRREAARPHGDEPRQLACLVVIAAERAVGRQPRRAEEDDGVADAGAAEAAQRRQVLREDAQRASVIAVEELLVPVGDGRLDGRGAFHSGSFVRAS